MKCVEKRVNVINSIIQSNIHCCEASLSTEETIVDRDWMIEASKCKCNSGETSNWNESLTDTYLARSQLIFEFNRVYICGICSDEGEEILIN